MLIDTHTHLYLPEFDTGANTDTPATAVERALDAGIGHMIFPNVDLTTVGPMHALHGQFPEVTSMAMGFHPTEVREDWREVLAQVMPLLEGEPQKYVAVGEIGIDLYWDKTFEEEQMRAFDQQVELAVRLGLPVIIHCREGLPQVLEVLQGHPGVRGVMHSFGGTEADIDAVRRVADLYFGINGIVTFKNCKVSRTIPAIGPDRLLLETDSPYLAPVPHRGKRNESAYMVHTARFIADSTGMTEVEVAAATTACARTLFRLPI